MYSKYKIEKVGKSNITARIVADSITHDFSTGELSSRITTFELEYPRFCHSELMTHRMFSRNAASSRAIPVTDMINLVENNIARPVSWNMNKRGMQSHIAAPNDLTIVDPIDNDSYTPDEMWKRASENAILYARAFNKAKLHKQIVNRILEPYQMIKVIVTATSFDNFFNLRLHADAQHEICELANVMYECYSNHTPIMLDDGDWHTPYYGPGYYKASDNNAESLEDALKISCSCAAQVSYRKLNDTLEKALDIYAMLVESDPVHASAFEHCATPITQNNVNDVAVTHMKRVYSYDEQGNATIEPYVTYGSGNFDNWIQYRQTIPNHVCYTFTK